jgi:hypothetical protein
MDRSWVMSSAYRYDLGAIIKKSSAFYRMVRIHSFPIGIAAELR